MAKTTPRDPRKAVGRYVDPVTRGRVTRRTPTSAHHSPWWYGWAILDLLLFGVIVITLNYLDVLPGATSAWYLALGLVAMFAGFYLATRFR